MRLASGLVLIFGIVLAASFVSAQPPGRPGGGSPSGDVTTFITRMMTFDANQDERLSKDEITDTRLVAAVRPRRHEQRRRRHEGGIDGRV